MIGRTLVAVTALVITLPAATVAAASAHEPRRERQLQAELDAIVAAGSPGTILLDRHNGRTLRLASGYAVTDSDLPSGSGLGVQRWRPCGVAWGHSGNSPGYLVYTWISTNTRHETVLLVNEDPKSLEPAAVKAYFDLLNRSFCDRWP
jgi:hypothetical protein